MNHDLHDTLTAELAPTTDALDRARWAYLAGRAEAPQPVRDTPRRRFPRLRLAMVASLAMVIVAAIAVAPFGDSERDHGVLPTPGTASAALQQAASGASDEPWHPLRTGEYHHVMTTSFSPVIPPTDGDSPEDIARIVTLSGPTSSETWLDRDGAGLTIDAMGGNGDPDLYPEVSSGGYGSQPTYGRDYPNIEPVEVIPSLRLADQVRVGRTLPGNRVDDSIWYRTPDGFERKAHKVLDRRMVTGGSFARSLQLRAWRATIGEVDAVNFATADERRTAVEQLLDTVADGYSDALPGQVGLFGVTTESKRNEARVGRAIKLLGSAPLSPEVRQELFTWLSEQGSATLEGDATDALGRSGVRVTFERIWRETLPARTITLDELRDDFERRRGVRPVVAGPARFDVPEDHQFRRWYASIVFDVDSGALLESVVYARQDATASRPRIDQPYRSGPVSKRWKVRKTIDRQAMFGAELYNVRERATDLDEAATLACRMTPEMCA